MMNAESDPMILKACANPLVAASFQELAEIDEEAVDLEIDPPSAEVKAVAKRILSELANEFPRYYMISLDEGGGILIQISVGARKGRGVLLLCDEQGVACFITTDGANTRKRYNHEEAKSFPDDFVRAAMRELD